MKMPKTLRFLIFTIFAILFAVFGSSSNPTAADEGEQGAQALAREAHFMRVQSDIQSDQDTPEALAQGMTSCVNGKAGSYSCRLVDLMAFLPIGSIGGGIANDIWGWTDPAFGTEYAILGRSTGTTFVDISDPSNPIYLGNLPTHDTSSEWRDVKIYKNRAYIVSESNNHGLQVFDLRVLRNVVSPPVTFSEENHYDGFGNAHNIVINEDTGYAYIVGSNSCSGGLHVLNIKVPSTPIFVNCITTDGYVHDAQCVIYKGPDERYQGSEICFEYNENSLAIVDVTRKQVPQQLSRVTYSGIQYTHQGWLTEDHDYLLLGDEKDETSFGHNTRTRIWDISNLKKPALIGKRDGVNKSTDHNMYVHNGLLFQSNYTSGLQIFYTAGVSGLNLPMLGYFDTYPSSNSAIYKGSWSNFPFFQSGILIVSSINEGLFVLKPVPDIDVPTGGLWTYQKPDVMSGRSMRIGNNGIGVLNWALISDASQFDVDLAAGTQCASPSDIPWLDVLEVSGVVQPGGYVSLRINLDSTGLGLGSYAANLCIGSDDSDESLINVPVVLVVNDWPSVFLPAVSNNP